MSKQSVKPVLLSEAQIQSNRKIQEKQRQQSGIGLRQLSMKSLEDSWIKH